LVLIDCVDFALSGSLIGYTGIEMASSGFVIEFLGTWSGIMLF